MGRKKGPPPTKKYQTRSKTCSEAKRTTRHSQAKTGPQGTTRHSQAKTGAHIHSELLRDLDDGRVDKLADFCYNQVLEVLRNKIVNKKTQMMKPSSNAMRPWCSTPQPIRLFWSKTISAKNGKETMPDYGFKAVLRSAGLNPIQHHWTHHFPDVLENASQYLAEKLEDKDKGTGRQETLSLNHVEVKVYFRPTNGHGGNHNYKIGKHRDCRFNLDREQDPSDTCNGFHPIVTWSIGAERELYFQHYFSESMDEYPSPPKTFVQRHGDVFVLKPWLDERPEPYKGDKIHAMHWAECKPKKSKKTPTYDISFALVFRNIKATSEFTTRGKRVWKGDDEKEKMDAMLQRREDELGKLQNDEEQLEWTEKRIEDFIKRIDEEQNKHKQRKLARAKLGKK